MVKSTSGAVVAMVDVVVVVVVVVEVVTAAVWQRFPVKATAAQSQLKVLSLTLSVQTPSFWHGLMSHSRRAQYT